MLQFKDVSINYYNHNKILCAVKNASLHCERYKITALLGPSGCGKTSLLQAAAALIEISNGDISIDELRVNAVREKTALLFQDYGLFPWKTVYDNAALALKLQHVPNKEIKTIVVPILEELGLIDFKSYFSLKLSGGMKQRVAIARALTVNADLLLMDEPFSSLDAFTREELQNKLLKIAQDRKLTVLLVTHSVEEAAFLADRIYIMQNNAPGNITKVIENTRKPSSVANLEAFDYRKTSEYFNLCVKIRESLNLSCIKGNAL